MKKSIFMSDIARIFTVVIFMVQYAAGAEITSWMRDMLNSVNSERKAAKEELSPLCYNAKVIAAAVTHNDDMVREKFFSHTGSDNSQAWDRLTNEQYAWNSVAENIARGQNSVQNVMTNWMNSPGHKGNILSDSNVHFGAAWDVTTNTWTQVFARSKNSNEVCMIPELKEVGEGCEKKKECKSNKCKESVCKKKKTKKENGKGCNKNSKCISNKCYGNKCRPSTCLDKGDVCDENSACCGLKCSTKKKTPTCKK